MEAKLLASDVGLGPDATPMQIVEKIKQLGREAQTRDGESATEQVLRLFSEWRADYPEAKETEFYARLGRDHYDLWHKWMSETREASAREAEAASAERRRLFSERGQGGTAWNELLERVSEIRATDTSLTEAQAVREAYRRDPRLFGRVTSEMRSRV